MKAYATDFDYQDYIITDSYLDGKNHLSIKIPIEKFSDPFWILQSFPDGDYVWNGTGSTCKLSIVMYPHDYSLTFMPFNGGDSFVVTDIPDGSKVRFEFDMDNYSGLVADMSVFWGINFYDQNYQPLTSIYTEPELGTFEVNYVEMDFNKPEGAVYCTFNLGFRGIHFYNNSNDVFNIVAKAFVFDIDIDAMQREQQISGQTNKLLEKVNDSLNTTVPGADDSINDSNDAQDRLEQAGDALANVPKPPVNDVNVSINSYLPSDSVTQSNNFFSYLWESELFMTMIILTFTMGTCSYILFGKR